MVEIKVQGASVMQIPGMRPAGKHAHHIHSQRGLWEGCPCSLVQSVVPGAGLGPEQRHLWPLQGGSRWPAVQPGAWGKLSGGRAPLEGKATGLSHVCGGAPQGPSS